MALTLYDGLVSLRNRVNDQSDSGQWAVAEKKAALNAALRRTLFHTRSYHLAQSLTIVADTHTYDAAPIFQPKGIRLGDNRLTLLAVGSLAIIEENWDALPADTPLRCIPVGGGRFRLAPTPDSGAAGIIGSVSATPTAGGAGYAVGDVLTITTGGSGAKVIVGAVSGGVVASLGLHYANDSQGRRVYYRGEGYTAGTGKATAADSGSGAGCTVNITALAKLEVYGPATIADLGAGRIATVASAPTAAGAGYTVNDILYITTGGAKGTVRVTGATNGAVTAVELVAAGVGYTVGSGKATSGGTGTGCTINITAVSDGSYLPIAELVEGAEEAWLLAAEEILRRSRPNMPGALQAAQACHDLWLSECESIRVALGIP